MATNDLTEALDEIRGRGYENGAHGVARLARLSDAAAVDVPRLLAALDEVLNLHVRQERPTKSWDQMCPEHAYDPATRSFGSFTDVSTCPDCQYTEFYICSHCECPNDRWPCPTVQAITRALMPIRSAGIRSEG